MGWITQRQWVLGALLVLAGLVRGDQPVSPFPRDETKLLIEEHEKAQTKVEKFFAASPDVKALMCTPPANVAFVEKSKNIQIPDSLDPTDTELGRFRAAGVPIFDSCQIWLSEKFGFAFIRQPKSSSKMVIRAVRKHLCRRAACLPEEFRLVELDEYPHLAPRLQQLFVFTFVRSPWTRALSAYSMFHQHFLYRRPDTYSNTPTEQCGIPFSRFAKDVGSLFDICEEDDCCSYITARDSWWPEFVNIHIGDHSHCMYLPNGEPLVDYIGLTEYFDAAWTDIMTAVDSRRNASNATAAAGGGGRGGAAGGVAGGAAGAGGAGRSLHDAMYDEPRRSGPKFVPGGTAPAVALAADAGAGPGGELTHTPGHVTVWHAVPAAGGGDGGKGSQPKASYVTTKAKVTHTCNSTRTLQYLNETTVLGLAKQYALDLVRLGYI